MTSFEDQTAATRMREVMHRMAIRALKEEGISTKYGTVTSIDLAQRRVMVQFPGDTTSVPVKLIGIQPTDVGQIVQVSGRKGDHFVSGVIGRASITDVAEGSLSPITLLTLESWPESIIADWTGVAEASKYEVQFAEDSGFTVNVRTFHTTDTRYTLSNLPTGTDYWVRVRALSASQPPVASTWVSAGPAQTSAFPAGDTTDGVPPASSPTPIITPGLGYLLAEWLPVANADPVVYDVHVSTTSGFTPDATNKVGEVYGTFFFVKRDGNDVELAYDTTYFVRVVARDADGAASPGPQASGQIDKVELGDVGNVTSSDLTDGAPPSTSPDVTDIHNGVGFLYVQWNHIVNNDQVTYEVHVSTVTGFTPDANTYVGETTSNWFFLRTQGAGALFADLVYGTTYYVKLWAKDGDGIAAAPGAQGSGFTVMVSGVDITDDSVTAQHMVAGTITAASGIIADLAIGTAKIQDAAITTAKILDLAVDTAKIANLAVTDAKIDTLSVAKLTAGTLTAETVIGTGRIGVGAGPGNTGIYLDSAGLRAYDGAVRTVFIDAATGDAEFTGTITGSSITGSTVIGGTVATQASGQRVALVNDGVNFNRVLFYSGDVDERLPGFLQVLENSNRGWLELTPPVFHASALNADVRLLMTSAEPSLGSNAEIHITAHKPNIADGSTSISMQPDQALVKIGASPSGTLQLNAASVEVPGGVIVNRDSSLTVIPYTNPATDAPVFQVEATGGTNLFTVGMSAKRLQVLSTGLQVAGKNIHTEVGAEVYRSTAQSIAHATWTTLTTDTLVTGGGGATRSTSGVNVPGATEPGWYLVTVTAVFSSIGVGTRCILDIINDPGGDSYRGRVDQEAPHTSTYVTTTGMFYMSTNSVVGVRVYHESGAAADVRLNSLSVVKVSPIQV